MANVLGELFGDIANAIREKTGDTATMKPAEFPSKISGIEAGGGGSSADVRYVTFMSYDGSVEYGKKAVAVGDDCADPIARGVFSTPTRESTAQYNYDFAGWATTPNGALNANWNKAVTEDRTVYANFAAILRYYTITYLDTDGSVLKTESLAYGAMPSYTPQKDGFGFGGWTPALAYVTADVSYTAIWTEKLTFANASWADIAEIAEAGNAREYFAVGDEKVISFNGSPLTLVVAGFDHDDLSTGDGKAAMSVICKTLPDLKVEFSDSTSFNYCYGQSNNELHGRLQNRFKSLLPTELQAVIKQVMKQVEATGNSGANPSLATFNCYLWPLSHAELNADYHFTTSSTPKNYVAEVGSAYELFSQTQGYGKFKREIADTGTYGDWWTRQIWRNGSYNPIFASGTTGTLQFGATVSAEKYVIFGFCI